MKENNYLFAFTGEFGYELISWMPYLKFLKEKGLYMRTLSRPDSKVLYNFSDEHYEHDIDYKRDSWGRILEYEIIKIQYHDYYVIYPHFDKEIIIEGYKWYNDNIHKSINTTNYSPLKYKLDEGPKLLKYPYWVIVNKYAKQWGMDRPVNFFSRDDLIRIKFMLDEVYGEDINSVYINHPEDRERGLDDNVFLWRSLNPDNELQLWIYLQSKYAITVQGGCAYLPIICGCETFIYIAQGDPTEFLELGRIYNTPVHIFNDKNKLFDVIKERL